MKFHTKLSFIHRVGNFMGGCVTIAEALVMILTFSYIMPSWSMDFIIWRLDSIFYENPKRKT